MIDLRGVIMMEYTIQKLANLANISTRTLRYYDEIDLLKPARINSSGYRIYGQSEVDRLQQILFYRELGVGLHEIKEIIMNPTFDEMQALMLHHQKLLEKRKQLDQLIETVNLTIQSRNGGIKMSDKQKFEGFKQRLVEENEEKYGQEIRQKYGNDVINASNKQFENLSEKQYEEMTDLAYAILATLEEAMETKNPGSELAQKLAKMHHQWLTYTWPSYSKEAHAGLAQMYVADERFTAYYDDRIKPGATQFLKDAILIYTNME